MRSDLVSLDPPEDLEIADPLGGEHVPMEYTQTFD